MCARDRINLGEFPLLLSALKELARRTMPYKSRDDNQRMMSMSEMNIYFYDVHCVNRSRALVIGV